MRIFFEKFPDRVMNRIQLITGLIIFFPVYYFNTQLTLKILNMEALKKLNMSFNIEDIKNILLLILKQENKNTFILVYILNIISTIGFMLFTFSLSIIASRAIKEGKRIKSISSLFPIMVFIITALDIVSSVLFILIINNIKALTNLTVYAIDSSYILRLFLIYLLFIWFIFILIYSIINKMKKRLI